MPETPPKTADNGSYSDGVAAEFIDMLGEAVEKCRALLGYEK